LIPSSRRTQRHVLIGLSGLVLLAHLRPLLVPRQPRLPRVPSVLNLGEGWHVAKADRAQQELPVLDILPPWRTVAVGPTVRLSRAGGQTLLLTPLASWNAKALDPEAAVRGINLLALHQPERYRIGQEKIQLARSGQSTRQLNDDSPKSQTCLTPNGGAAHAAEDIEKLLGFRDPPFLQRLTRSVRNMIFFSDPRIPSCVLITSSAEAVFADKSHTKQLLSRIHSAVNWNRTP
jgi:hypothetical protein